MGDGVGGRKECWLASSRSLVSPNMPSELTALVEWRVAILVRPLGPAETRDLVLVLRLDVQHAQVVLKW